MRENPWKCTKYFNKGEANMSKLRIMSQNQWNFITNLPLWEEQGFDCSSEVRMKGHARVFKELMPDIIGGQEVNIQMHYDLMINCKKQNLPYTLLWGYMTPIIYRADKLELLDTEWLLYPEEMDGFEGTFHDYYSKGANLAVFKCKEDGELLIFVTTHLWWMNGTDPNHRAYRKGSDQVRRLQLKMVIDLIDKYQEKYGKCPVFLAGDMNAEYNSEAIQYALNERGYSHAHDVATEFAHEGSGYNGCGALKIGEWDNKPFETAIDHILVRNFENVNIRRFDRYTPDYYLYLSDHAPIFVDVDFK